MVKIGFFLTFIFLSSLSWAFQLQKIIGDEKLLPVSADASNIQKRLRPLVNAIGKASNACTVTHIGGGYVITAGHCFFAGDKIMENVDCADTTIDWGYRENLSPYLVSKCEKIIAAQNSANEDYALIKVYPIPPAAIAPDVDRMAVIGDTITIFSHPDEMPLRWSGLCGIEREQHLDLPQESFQYNCDTKRGSSGAGVLNYLSLKIVGVHNGGTNFNGEMNYGTKIMSSALYRYLKSIGF